MHVRVPAHAVVPPVPSVRNSATRPVPLYIFEPVGHPHPTTHPPHTCPPTHCTTTSSIADLSKLSPLSGSWHPSQKLSSSDEVAFCADLSGPVGRSWTFILCRLEPPIGWPFFNEIATLTPKRPLLMIFLTFHGPL